MVSHHGNDPCSYADLAINRLIRSAAFLKLVGRINVLDGDLHYHLYNSQLGLPNNDRVPKTPLKYCNAKEFYNFPIPQHSQTILQIGASSENRTQVISLPN